MVRSRDFSRRWDMDLPEACHRRGQSARADRGKAACTCKRSRWRDESAACGTCRREALRRNLEVYRRDFASALVRLQLVDDLLAFAQRTNAGLLESADMDEYVLAAAGRLDESVATLITVPFNCTLNHGRSLGMGCTFDAPETAAVRFSGFLGSGSERAPGHAQANRLARPAKCRCAVNGCPAAPSQDDGRKDSVRPDRRSWASVAPLEQAVVPTVSEALTEIKSAADR